MVLDTINKKPVIGDAQIQILESLDDFEMRLKGNKHIKVLALNLLLSVKNCHLLFCILNQGT